MTDSKTLEKAREILMKTATLGSIEDLPKSRYEYHKRIWRAFHLGEEHQHLREEEVRRQSNEE